MKVRSKGNLQKALSVKPPFTIDSSNRHKYDYAKGVYMRKDRLSTVITVDANNVVISIKGDNPKKTKIGDIIC